MIRPKEFSSDKKVENIFSCVTANKASTLVESGQLIGNIEDCGSLLLTFLMSKLHLHAVNEKHALARHRSAHIGVNVLLLISIDGISPISKKNVVLQSIGNIFFGFE